MKIGEKFNVAVRGAVIFVAAFMCFRMIAPIPTLAQATPSYGTFPYSVGYISSTAGGEILAAPGTDKRWVITGVNYGILVGEASKLINILDHSGSTPAGATTGATSVAICEFAPTTSGYGQWIDFGTGIPCATNSAVMVENTGTTADVWISVNAYVERTE